MRWRHEVRDSPNSGGPCGICPRILQLERLVRKQQCKGLGSGQARGVHEPAILKGPPGLERQETGHRALSEHSGARVWGL